MIRTKASTPEPTGRTSGVLRGRRRTKTGAAASPVPSFAFCEPVTAIPMGRWHIRAVGPEGLKHGGGAPNDALCGRELHKGWDLEPPITPEFALRLVTPRAGDGHIALCPACYAAWLEATGSA